MRSRLRRGVAAVLGSAILLAAFPAAGLDLPDSIVVPNFWDPAHRLEKPDLSELRRIRFLTEAQNPPFSFVGADGYPTGFHVDLARAICLELDMACTIQSLRWELLLDGIEDGRGDAIIASLAINEETHARYDFSHRYLSRPARFVARRQSELPGATPEELSGRKVAVVRGTAHEAYLRSFFPGAAITPFDDDRSARRALQEGEVAALFGDGLNLSLWLNGAASERCCAFIGGPYTESRYFGEGFAIAVASGDQRLKQALDFALARVYQTGAYAEIFLRYFPVSFY